MPWRIARILRRLLGRDPLGQRILPETSISVDLLYFKLTDLTIFPVQKNPPTLQKVRRAEFVGKLVGLSPKSPLEALSERRRMIIETRAI